MRLEAITTMTDPVLSPSDEIDAIINGRKPSNHRGVPVWSHTEMICTGEAYMDKVKLTFARGASLPDPVELFNSSLGGNTRRAIELFEGDTIDEDAFRALVKNFWPSTSLDRSSLAVEGQKFGLAPISNVVESGDADCGESAGRWCADLGEVDL